MMYLVCSLKKDIEAMTLGIKTKLILNWADGMIGVTPVFDNREDAEKYANGKVDIREIEEIK